MAKIESKPQLSIVWTPVKTKYATALSVVNTLKDLCGTISTANACLVICITSIYFALILFNFMYGILFRACYSFEDTFPHRIIYAISWEGLKFGIMFTASFIPAVLLFTTVFISFGSFLSPILSCLLSM
jgi:hypothetical protein